jgi:hypothetical protein
VLGACDKKPKLPAIDSLDRSCKVDTDCALAVATCCTGCRGAIGEPVNAKAWETTLDAREAHCKGQKCPDLHCAKLPDCRDEAIAICRKGICDREMRANAACTKLGVKPSEYCESKDDCRLQSFHDDCCDHCGGTPMNKAAAHKARSELEKKCGTTDRQCPAIDCPAPPIDCVEHKCVVPTATPADDFACETTADCELFTMQNCCDVCEGGRALNKPAAARERAKMDAACAGKKVDCPTLDCRRLPAVCIDKKCTVRK